MNAWNRALISIRPCAGRRFARLRPASSSRIPAKDGAAAPAELRRTLLHEHFSVWQDSIALEGGRDWWSQIENALRSKGLQHLVLIVTRAAFASPVVRREIRLARQEGKTVSPVKGPGLGELSNLPRWLGQVYDPELREYRTTLLRNLPNSQLAESASAGTRSMRAPEPPPDVVERCAEFNALKRKPLDAKGDAMCVRCSISAQYSVSGNIVVTASEDAQIGRTGP
jgi:hypothetical protein